MRRGLSKFPTRHCGSIRCHDDNPPAWTQDPPCFAHTRFACEIDNMNREDFIDRIVSPRQSVDSAPHQMNTSLPNGMSIMAQGLSEHDLGMIQSPDEPLPGHSCQKAYGRPRSAAEIQDRVVRRTIQRTDRNPIGPSIGDRHQAGNQPAAKARRISQLPADGRPDWRLRHSTLVPALFCREISCLASWPSLPG